MSDPLSIAGSVVGIAAAGVQVSISLFALVETVSTASERVESIANDISSTCGILNQLRDLITPQSRPNDTHTSIFNSNALSDISSALHHCQSIFGQVKKYLERATRQVKGIIPPPNSKIKLSRSEKAKWPFLQPQFNDLRTDLRDSKTNLLLMVAVANLAIVQKQSSGRRVDEREQTEMKATILRLQRAGTLKVSSSDDMSEEEKENGVKKFFQKISFRNGGRKKRLEGDVDDNKDRNNEKDAETTVGAEQVTSNEAVRQQSNPNQPPAADTNLTHQNQLASGERNTSQADCSPVSGSLPTEALLSKTSARNSEGLIKADAGRSATPNSENPQDNIEKDVSQNHQTSKTLHARRAAIHGPFTETKTNSSLLHKSKQHQQGPPEGAAPQKSEATNVEEPKSSSPGTKTNDVHEFLQAWTFSVLPGLSSGFGASLGIVELTLLETEIHATLQKQEAQNRSPLKTLHDLNSYQRHLILAHIESRDAKLLHVDVWHKESVPTVFGQLDIVTLVWITSSAERKEGPIDIETLFREKEAIPSEAKATINFKDAVGRKFTFPYHLVKSWKSMEELIKQAFLHVDIIGPHIQEGHYDLMGPDGQVILPQVWQYLVQPGWNVTMHMWPMPEPSQPAPPPEPSDPLRNRPPSPPPPPPPPPPEATYFSAGTLDDSDSEISSTSKTVPSPFFRWAAGKSSSGATKLKMDKGKPSSKLVEEWNGKNRDKVVESLLLKWTGDEEVHIV